MIAAVRECRTSLAGPQDLTELVQSNDWHLSGQLRGWIVASAAASAVKPLLQPLPEWARERARERARELARELALEPFQVRAQPGRLCSLSAHAAGRLPLQQVHAEAAAREVLQPGPPLPEPLPIDAPVGPHGRPVQLEGPPRLQRSPLRPLM